MAENKYHAKKVMVDGEVFDSRREYRRWMELRLLEKAGVIKDLRRQVKYTLIPAQRETDTVGSRGGVRKGKVIEKECAYIADFVYKENGQTVVEDAKGHRTDSYIIKRKLMLQVYGIRVREV